jgi:Ran GTPase-activating protein (RanGAP) involved in mRNA processing and transport
LRCCGVGELGARALAEALAAEGCALTYLNVEYNQIPPKGIAALARAMAGTRLCEADLKWNEAGDEGATALADTLALAACQLESLNLLQNQLSDGQALTLARGVSANVSLTELDVGQNFIASAGFDALWRAAVKCPSLLLCKMDAHDAIPEARLVEAEKAAAARAPPLKLALERKGRATTGTQDAA